MKEIYSLLSGVILFLFATQVAAVIEHEKPVSRPADFQVISDGYIYNARFNIKEYDSSLIKYVKPTPLQTFVEMMRLHSESYVNSFEKTFEKAEAGKSTMFSASFDKQAQNNYNVMLQDYLPMNEADAAAALYLFNVKDCAIRKTKEFAGVDMSMCQYYGTRIMGQIIKRLTPIHWLLSTGSISPGSINNEVKLKSPKEIVDQIGKIISLFSTIDVENYLQKIQDPSAKMWEIIKKQNGSYDINN